MIYVAILNAAALVAAVIAFAGLIRSLIRQHARERDLLVNQLCHLAGRTWTAPPARDPEPAEPVEPRWVDPNQLSDDELLAFAGDET